MRRTLPSLVVFAMLAAFADEPPPFVPGILPNAPGKGIRVRALKPARRAPLLRSTTEELPAYWNSASNGWVTSVKHQHDLGNCWAFAALATIETQLLKSGRGEYDFSEKNMAKLCGMEFGYYGKGAYSYTPAGYLLRWSGPVAEEKDPYVGTKDAWPSANSPALPSELHVQDVVWIPALDGTGESRAALKRAILDYGAIATSMYWSYSCACSNYAYHCYTYSASANHAVTIVGWDDNLSKELFGNPPESDGAWIIKNSWGTGIGEGGFCYVSYCDTGFARDDGSVYLPAAEGAPTYDAVHGYAIAGPKYDTSQEGCFPQLNSDLQAVVFTAASGESLAAVGLWTAVYPYEYEISVYTNVVRHATSRWDEVVPCTPSTSTYGTVYPSEDPLEGGTCALTQSGTLARGGYTTVPLEREIPLAPGSSYAVVFKQTGSAASVIVATATPVPEDPIYGSITFRPGNGYVGWSKNDATNRWYDAYDYGLYAADTKGWAICINAYTRLTDKARASDIPSATDNGADMLAELADTGSLNPAAKYFNGTYGFESLAKLVGANGRTLWASWLLGLDPANADMRDISLSIDVSSGVPRISWDPALPGRAYTLYGRDSLSSDASWYAVPTNELDTTSARFFRLSIGPVDAAASTE